MVIDNQFLKKEGVSKLNAEGIYNNADFRKGEIDIVRTDYDFPEEMGIHTIEGVAVCRYWGKKGNLILLVETDEGRKLKFSFWNNTKYCCEPIPKRRIDVENESVRYLADGTRIRLTYQRSEFASITRIRELMKQETY